MGAGDAFLKGKFSYQLAGWVLFILCSIFYILSGIHSRDAFSLTGGILFFIACIVFIIPLILELTK
jgi:Na+/proline symporter